MSKEPKKTEVEPDGKTAAQKRVEKLEAEVAELTADLQARKEAAAEAERAALEAKETEESEDGWDEFLP